MYFRASTSDRPLIRLRKDANDPGVKCFFPTTVPPTSFVPCVPGENGFLPGLPANVGRCAVTGAANLVPPAGRKLPCGPASAWPTLASPTAARASLQRNFFISMLRYRLSRFVSFSPPPS